MAFCHITYDSITHKQSKAVPTNDKVQHWSAASQACNFCSTLIIACNFYYLFLDIASPAINKNEK